METIKQNSTLVLAVVAIAAITLVSSVSKPVSVQLSDTESKDHITVSGESERLVAPDTARVSFTMTRKDTSLATATDSVNKRIEDMLDGLGKFDVEEKDIKTTNYSVNPEYDYNRADGQRVFSGYRVNQSIELTIRDLDQAGPIMTAIADFKVDNVSGLQFFVDRDEQIKEELRAEAISDAKQKAKKLSKELGVNLDVIVGFSENNSGGYFPQPYMRMDMMAESADSVQMANIPAGENTLQSNISITYKITN